MICRLNICSVVLLSALKPACSSAPIFFMFMTGLLSMIFNNYFAKIADKADGSVVLA